MSSRDLPQISIEPQKIEIPDFMQNPIHHRKTGWIHPFTFNNDAGLEEHKIINWTNLYLIRRFGMPKPIGKKEKHPSGCGLSLDYYPFLSEDQTFENYQGGNINPPSNDFKKPDEDKPSSSDDKNPVINHKNYMKLINDITTIVKTSDQIIEDLDREIIEKIDNLRRDLDNGNLSGFNNEDLQRTFNEGLLRLETRINQVEQKERAILNKLENLKPGNEGKATQEKLDEILKNQQESSKETREILTKIDNKIQDIKIPSDILNKEDLKIEEDNTRKLIEKFESNSNKNQEDIKCQNKEVKQTLENMKNSSESCCKENKEKLEKISKDQDTLASKLENIKIPNNLATKEDITQVSNKIPCNIATQKDISNIEFPKDLATKSDIENIKMLELPKNLATREDIEKINIPEIPKDLATKSDIEQVRNKIPQNIATTQDIQNMKLPELPSKLPSKEDLEKISNRIPENLATKDDLEKARKDIENRIGEIPKIKII